MKSSKKKTQSSSISWESLKPLARELCPNCDGAGYTIECQRSGDGYDEWYYEVECEWCSSLTALCEDLSNPNIARIEPLVTAIRDIGPMLGLKGKLWNTKTS